jgi:hypothetical protein
MNFEVINYIMKKLSALIFLSLLLINLTSNASENKYPKSARDQRSDNFGSVLGGDEKGAGGFSLFGLGKKDQNSDYKGLGVNVYLWKASLEVISFMPIAISDSAGGIITTEWSEDLDHPGERHKINVFIKSTELNTHSLKVTVFKQVLKENVWRSVKTSDEIVTDIEDKILTKARQIKLAQEH